MNEEDRAAHVQLAAGGDSDALQRLIVYYHAPLHGVVGRALSADAGPHLDPDEVLQDTYVAAFRAVVGCKFDGPGGFYKWIEKIALNQLRNRRRDLRRKKRDVTREIVARNQTTSHSDLLARVISPQSTPSRQLARQEATAAVMSSLARLTDDRRRVVQMRFLAGMSVPDVASALDKTENAVHVTCHRALTQLRDLLISISSHLAPP